VAGCHLAAGGLRQRIAVTDRAGDRGGRTGARCDGPLPGVAGPPRRWAGPLVGPPGARVLQLDGGRPGAHRRGRRGALERHPAARVADSRSAPGGDAGPLPGVRAR
jgi:hypothetical protein